MQSWQWAVLLKPLFVLAYIAAIAVPLWLARRYLPEGRLKRLVTYEFPQNRATAALMFAIVLAFVALVIYAGASSY